MNRYNQINNVFYHADAQLIWFIKIDAGCDGETINAVY